MPRVKCHNVYLSCFCMTSSGTCQGLEVLWQLTPVPAKTTHCLAPFPLVPVVVLMKLTIICLMG